MVATVDHRVLRPLCTLSSSSSSSSSTHTLTPRLGRYAGIDYS